MILPEDTEKATIERAWQEEDRLRHHQPSPRPESIASYRSASASHRNEGLPLPPPPYYNPNPFHATVGAFSTEDLADSTNFGFARRRSSRFNRPRSPTGSFSSTLDEAEGQSHDPFSDSHLQPRPRSARRHRGVYGAENDLSRVQAGGSSHRDAIGLSLSSTGFNAAAVPASEEHRAFFDRRGSNGEDTTSAPSTETAIPQGHRGSNKGKQRNKEWIAEPDVNAHKTVVSWDGTVSDLGRWLSDHAAASTSSFKRRKWKRWNKKNAEFDALEFEDAGSGWIKGCSPVGVNGAPAEDGVASHCNAFVDLPENDILRGVSFSPSGLNQSIASYILNQNASSIFIHTQGDASTGMIQIVGSDDKRLMDAGAVLPGKIRVDVIMRTAYNETKALVCKMSKEDGGQGVGVYTSAKTKSSSDETVAPDPNLSFVVIVRLPYVAASKDLQTIQKFAVINDQMSVRFGEMTNVATFKNVTVALGRGLISASYLAAEDISFKTRTSSIMGTFNVSNSLNVNTTNGGLSSRVILHNPLLKADPYVNDTATYLPSSGDQSHLDLFRRDFRATTNDRRYDSQPENYDDGWASDTSPAVSVKMGTTSSVFSSETGSRYMDPDTAPINAIKVRAMTTNGPLSIRYLYQAPGVVLDSSVQTRNGEARTQMHPAFQGSFLVRSVNGDLRMEPNFNGTVETDDPWNLSRTKLVLFSQGSGRELGGWNDTSLEIEADARAVYGNMRGGMAYNTAEGSWVSMQTA
ncbi:hypothetical protein QFC19_001347 [Naganishia cerealis]|uniref:Uncharacterized protein n=1 Tax=Naganishia cerealis TaxID=610337 RepID=A0ACC2WHF6_9TREE|nr:hypothetical protein QFC19_001347 [Naganishia cerealis]